MINIGNKLILISVILILVTGVTSVWAQDDTRFLPVDFIFLVDKSKSMVNVLEDVKKYLAGDLIGPLIIPGDKVHVSVFYRYTETLWSGLIKDDKDKADLVRALNAVKPDGAYTDIGNALDAVDDIIYKLDDSTRPKFVLLLTDERQEAPEGTKYFASDYKVQHPYLDFIKREDHGNFRVITVGYGLEKKITDSLQNIITILESPPERDKPDEDYAWESPGMDGISGATEYEITPESEEKFSIGSFFSSEVITIILTFAGIAVSITCLIIVIILLLKRKKRKELDENPK